MAARPVVQPTSHLPVRNYLSPAAAASLTSGRSPTTEQRMSKAGSNSFCRLTTSRASMENIDAVGSYGHGRAIMPPGSTLKLPRDVNVQRFEKLLLQAPEKLLDALNERFSLQKLCCLIGSAGFLVLMEQPALAVTGAAEEDLFWTLISAGIIAFWYFLVMPPIIFNWLRLRWYKRKLLEMYVQFLCVFMFFPGLMLWAPFLNFRQMPRDPSMKYPWSTPLKDTSS
ncbi:uncharacterized protein LOC116249728 [Nymphaea colorata]|nr:uncharacterized protein LOC116249728 [Nymphaea colorata]